MSSVKPYMPLYTDLTDKKVMVAGSGDEGGQVVRYISSFTDHLYYLAPGDRDCGSIPASGVTVLRKPYERSDLLGMDYVISLIKDEAVNEDIFAACRTLGIRVFIKDSPKRCDFFLADRSLK